MKDFFILFYSKCLCSFLEQMVKNTTLTTETREGRPLLTVETEANGVSRIYKRDPSLVGSLARCAGTRDFCSALAFLVGPV
jgi:hypothetical protein